MADKEKEKDEEKKQIIGLLGEMHLAMRLHDRGWQVYRAYIDSNVDFILTKYWCRTCKKHTNVEKRKIPGEKKRFFPTDCCASCLNPTLMFDVRFIQVKTSEGKINKKRKKKTSERDYSFRVKLRSNIDPRSFYAWIALVPTDEGIMEPHCFIFRHDEANKFDNLELDTYQKKDNPKTTLHINKEGRVIKKGRTHSYDCFNDDFYNNFEKLDEPIEVKCENSAIMDDSRGLVQG